MNCFREFFHSNEGMYHFYFFFLNIPPDAKETKKERPEEKLENDLEIVPSTSGVENSKLYNYRMDSQSWVSTKLDF